MPKLIVFDMDGTLLNSMPLFSEIAYKYSEKNGLPLPNVRAIQLGYGRPDDFDFGWNVDKEEQRRHLHAILASLDDAKYMRENPMPLFDGVTDMLRRLSHLGYTMAIVTSKPLVPLKIALEQHNIGGFFKTVRTWDDVAAGRYKEKPAPDKLISVMRELSFKPEQTAMIGDTTMDIEMGINAKTHAIGVAWGAHPPENLKKAGAHLVLQERCDEIYEALEKIAS